MFKLFRFILRLNIVRKEFLKVVNLFILVLWKSIFIIVENEDNKYKKIMVKGIKFLKKFDFIINVNDIRFLLKGVK